MQDPHKKKNAIQFFLAGLYVGVGVCFLLMSYTDMEAEGKNVTCVCVPPLPLLVSFLQEGLHDDARKLLVFVGDWGHAAGRKYA